MKLAEAEIGGDLGSLPDATKRRVLVEFLIENQLFADAAESQKLALRGRTTTSACSTGGGARCATSTSTRASRTASAMRKPRSSTTAQVGGAKAEDEVRARHILVESKEKARELFEKMAARRRFCRARQAVLQRPRLARTRAASSALLARPDGAAVRGGGLQTEERRGRASPSRPSSAGISSRSTSGAQRPAPHLRGRQGSRIVAAMIHQKAAADRRPTCAARHRSSTSIPRSERSVRRASGAVR